MLCKYLCKLRVWIHTLIFARFLFRGGANIGMAALKLRSDPFCAASFELWTAIGVDKTTMFCAAAADCFWSSVFVGAVGDTPTSGSYIYQYQGLIYISGNALLFSWYHNGRFFFRFFFDAILFKILCGGNRQQIIICRLCDWYSNFRYRSLKQSKNHWLCCCAFFGRHRFEFLSRV